MRHSVLLKAKCEIIIAMMPKWSKLGILPDSYFENMQVNWRVREATMGRKGVCTG